MNLEKATRNLNRMAIPTLVSPLVLRGYWFQYHPKAPTDHLKQHRHTFFEAHFMVEGKTDYIIQDRNVCVKAGEILLISPGTVHAVTAYSEKYQKFAIGFSIEEQNKNPFAKELYRLFSKDFHTVLSQSEAFRHLFFGALSVAENPNALTPFRIRDILFALVEEMARILGGMDAIALNAPDMTDARVSRAKLYITDNIRRPFTLAEVAANVHLSEKQLCRIFFAEEGRAIRAFIRDEKLKEAKALLAESDEPLRNISETLGWSSEYNFIRFFHAAEGTTPGAFRRVIRNKAKI